MPKPSLWIERFESALSLPPPTNVQGTSIKTIMQNIHQRYKPLIKAIPSELDEKSGAPHTKKSWKEAIEKIVKDSTELYLQYGRQYYIDVSMFATESFSTSQESKATTDEQERIRLILQQHAIESKQIQSSKKLNDNISEKAFTALAQRTKESIQEKRDTTNTSSSSSRQVNNVSGLASNDLDTSLNYIMSKSTSPEFPLRPQASSSQPRGLPTSTTSVPIYYSDDEMEDEDDPILDMQLLPNPRYLVQIAEVAKEARSNHKARNEKNKKTLVEFLETYGKPELEEDLADYQEAFKKTKDSVHKALLRIEEALNQKDKTKVSSKKRKRLDVLFQSDDEDENQPDKE